MLSLFLENSDITPAPSHGSSYTSYRCRRGMGRCALFFVPRERAVALFVPVVEAAAVAALRCLRPVREHGCLCQLKGGSCPGAAGAAPAALARAPVSVWHLSSGMK